MPCAIGAMSSKNNLTLDQDEEPLDVLDLPQLYTRPTAATLLSTLSDLSFEPPSWNRTPISGTPPSGISYSNTPKPHLRKRRKIKSEGVPSYLTAIISSPLAWIEHDEEKEKIWESASQRLSERSGRTGMGAISRTFSIPITTEHVDTSGVYDGDKPSAFPEILVEITLHEPALTADNLGLKTWAASFLLACRLCILRSTLPKLDAGARVLELGAGTGLVGLAAAVVLRADIVLTDLPEIVSNLKRNADGNFSTIAKHGGMVETAVLDWAEPEKFRLENQHHPTNSFPLILVADPIYSPSHPRLLVQAIDAHLAKDKRARVVIEIPIREAFASERNDLRDRMNGIGLILLDKGEEIGFDDWASGHDEEQLAEVTCRWTVWGWP